MRWIDEYGVPHDYYHDTLGRLRRVVVDDQPEASFTYVYNAIGLLESSLDDLGRGTLYAYDDLGRMTVQQNARTADATIFGYNGDLLTTAISPLGNTATYLYNDPNDPSRLTGVIEPSGDTVQFTWDGAANNLIYTSPRGNRTTYSFDSVGALWRITDALGREHNLRYDSAGNLTQWRQTQRAVNGNNPDVSVAARILTIDRPTPYQAIISSPNTGLDWSRTFEYSPLGLLESVAGQNGQPLAFDYDPLGRLTTVESSGQTWTIAYADGEPELTYTDGNGFENILRFDALRRLVAETSMDQTVTYRYITGRSADVNLFIDDGETTRIIAYAAGNESSRPPSVILRAPGQRTTYTYNGEGSLTDITSEACIEGAAMTEIDPQNPDDCISAATDAVWRANERFIYDALGRPTRFIDAEQNITTFSYDDAGNLVIHQDSGDRTFNYTYDRMSRLASLTGPTGIRLLLEYDDLDRVTGICRQRVEDSDNYNDCASAGGVLERYSYDGLGRLASQTYSNVDATNDQTALLYSYNPQNEGLLSGWGVASAGGVTIVRGDDGLGLVDRLSAGNATYTVQRESRFRVAAISGAGNAESLGYQYDEQGRLAAIVTGDQTLSYAYLPNNSGYTITDDASGETISFMLDERGFLSQISGDAQFSYFLNPDGRILLVQIERGEGGEPVELQLNQRGETQSVLYSRSNLLIDYVSAPSGETQRETIIGSAELFELDAGGYIIVIGYDNDGRPLTVRVNDRESGKLLHLLTFTYSVFGQRETETRQFADGTQVNIEYEYDGVQLVERRVSRSAANERQTTHNNPLDVVHSGSPLLALGVGLAWALRRNKRKRLYAAFFVMGLLIAVTLTLTVAQQTPNGATFLYAYTERGNLASVSVAETETVCAVYAYDNANRLIAVTRGDFEQTYSYDARNRLATIGDQRLAYLGDSNTLLGVYDADGGLRLTGQSDGTPPIFQTDGDVTVDLLNDGRRNILATVNGDEVSVPVRIFDPLGRYLPLTLETPDSNNPCAETSVPPELAALAPVQIMPNSMIWDAATNLHIANGRAYSPSIGRYLQRDPQGPDAFGAIYNFPSRQTAPPVRQRIAPYADGLIRLRDAMNAIQTPTSLTADAVAQSQYPGYDPHNGESLYSLLREVRRTTDERLQRQLDLPVWLTNHYSLPAPSIDASGALRMSTISAPGLGGTGEPFIETKAVFDPADDWLPVLDAPALHLQGLTDMASATIPVLTLYEPFQWRPMLPELADGWENHTPQLGRAYTPSAVMDFLPQTLTAPQDAVAALNAVAALIELPYRNGETWLDSVLDSALPTLPVLPPADSDAWLSNWFSRDTFGLGAILDQRWASPPSAELPIYHLGANADWTLSRHR
jgi:YD repeat-containing protein